MEKEDLKKLVLEMYETEKELLGKSRDLHLKDLVKQVVEEFGGVETFVERVNVPFPCLPGADKRKQQLQHVRGWLKGDFYYLFHLSHNPNLLENAINQL